MPDGWHIVASETGYVTEEIFFNWFEEVFIPNAKPSATNPCILLMDNHASHISARIIKLAMECHVSILNQPPHSSHFLQPLDKIFGLLKDGISSSSHAAQLIHASAQVIIYLTYIHI